VIDEAILADIRKGGRFRAAIYCFSILILTFRRSLDVRYVPAGKCNAGPAALGSFITVLFGWWGIPWGPIYSIGALIANFNGGKDLTKDILAARVGEAEAKNFLARSEKSRATVGLWTLRAAILLGPGLIMALLVGGAAMSTKQHADRLANDPSFSAYHEFIDSLSPAGAGNTQQARDTALRIAQAVDAVVEESLEGEDGAGASRSDCSAACYESAKGSLVLVRVSAMKEFTAEAKQDIVDMVWTLAAATLASPENAGRTLTVGVGGRYLWDGARSGPLSGAGEEVAEPEVTVASGAEGHLSGAFAAIWTAPEPE